MTVLHISRTMGQGGAEKIVYQLCKDNHNLEQMIASIGGIYVTELDNMGVKHFLIPDIEKKNPMTILKTIYILQSIIHKNGVDIIHTHHRMAAFYARILQFFNKNIKHVYTAHNIFYGKRKFLKFALKNAIVIAVGNSVKKNLIDEYGIPDSKITVIYNAIDVSHMSSYKNELIEQLINNGNYIIGTLGRLSAQKGIDTFIQAMKTVSEKEPRLKAVVIGDGELKSNMQHLVVKLGLQNVVYFLGFQSHVLEIIQQLQFVVLASRWEGLPLIPIETFSQGKTIIVTDIPGNNEIVKDKVNGLIVSKGNSKELAQKILLLMRNHKLKENLENVAFKTYVECYSYPEFINKYKQIYKTIEQNTIY